MPYSDSAPIWMFLSSPSCVQPKAYPDIEREVKGEDEIRTIKSFEKRRQEVRTPKY